MVFEGEDVEVPGGIIINPASELGKELRKWEQHRTEYVGRGQNPGNPYVFRPYPAMLYKAQPNPNGKMLCLDIPPNSMFYDSPAKYERDCLIVDSFNRSCQRIVKDEGENARARSEGWRETPQAALAHAEALAHDVMNAAAEAAAAVRRMSSKAKDEYAQADASTHEQVTDVTGSSKKTRGRTAKSKAVTGTSD